jgi:hypothetical protein
VPCFSPPLLHTHSPLLQVAVIEDMRPESVVVETELFPRGALEFYTAKNMGWECRPRCMALTAAETRVLDRLIESCLRCCAVLMLLARAAFAGYE